MQRSHRVVRPLAPERLHVVQPAGVGMVAHAPHISLGDHEEMSSSIALNREEIALQEVHRDHELHELGQLLIRQALEHGGLLQRL
eukprot:scaffold1147_cov250-Pinguiococcus_pyrenoidosus.AAC.2